MPATSDFLVVFAPAADRLAGAPPPQRCASVIETWERVNGETMLRICADSIASAESALWRVWLLGEARFLSAPAQPARAQTLAERLCAGQFDPNHLTGHFLVIALDASTGCWHIWTDRFATLHAYHTPGALGSFSPAVMALGARRALDWVGMAGFLRNGFFPADRTYEEATRILPPATHTLLDGRGLLVKQERYWHWSHQPDERRDFDATVAAFAEVFHTVLHEQVAGRRVALPISGGLDSRSTVAALADGNTASALWAYSYGYAQNSVETNIAAQIASARGFEFQAFTIQPYLFDRLPQITAAVEGFQDVTQCRQAAITAELATHADWVMAAHWGDVWFDRAGADDQTPVADAMLRKFAKPGSEWLIANLIQPSAPGALTEAEDLLRGFANDYAKISDADFRLKAIKTDTWSFRWTTASLRAYHAGALPLLPFYDTRIADFFASVPAHFLKGRALQIAYLKRFAPDLARITWQEYDANLYDYRYFRSLLLPKRAYKKLRRLILRQPVTERNWEVQFRSPGARAHLDAWLSAPGRKIHRLIAPQKIRALLDALDAPPVSRETGAAVSMLLTLSAWLEQYGA